MRSNSITEALIAEWVNSERDRAILRRALIDSASYERIAEEHDMSSKQIGRIVRRFKRAFGLDAKTPRGE